MPDGINVKYIHKDHAKQKRVMTLSESVKYFQNLFNKNEESRENVSPRRKSNGGGNDRIRKQNEKLERKRRREKRRKEFVDKLKRKIN